MTSFPTTLITPIAALIITASSAWAQTATHLMVLPSNPLWGASVVTGVAMDAAPGFPHGSVAGSGVAKAEIYFTPEMLFAGPITLGDIADMSYWTKTGATHATDPRDWFLAIYTAPYAGDVSTPTWYGSRIGSEPYFAMNPDDPANTWNQWSSDGATNRMRFFESTAGAPGATFGTYGDPDWATFVAGNALSGHPYAAQNVLYISIQTGSAWAAGFTGQLDGLRIELTDGSLATVNFEPFPVAGQIEACKKNAWMNLYRANGGRFKNQGDCVSYVNTGR